MIDRPQEEGTWKLAELGNAAAALDSDRASAMTATLAKIPAAPSSTSRSTPGEGSLERQFTPVERPTANNRPPPPRRHQQRELLVMDHTSAGTEAAAAAHDGSAH
jgi:hypothetical protein